MQELADDLRAALDQVNHNLAEIVEQNEKQTELLKQIAAKLGES